MKVTKDTLGITTDRWSDPGDYPNSLASGPLPDGQEYVEEVYGEVVVEEYEKILNGIYSDDHLEEFHPELHELLTERIPDGISVLRWSVTSDGALTTFEVNDFDADEWEPPEPDYEED